MGSAYASFIAVNDQETKKKLNYRVYLGGKDYSDFNLYENTDYTYAIKFNHEGIPTNDRRVTYIDPIPASVDNENFVNTANCFMVAPGGYFNFNPYKFYRKGNQENNDLLQSWCLSTKIQSVKVLWQTLENGDIGDPVLGTVTSSDEHTNIVDIKNGDNFETARIYCRVAPNTTGGSGLITAYSGNNGTGEILWSWHIWVTDYSPDATLNETVLEPANKRILKFSINGANQRPMMDRNLGANAGYIDKVPAQEIDRSKANGFHYQWGRKELFPSSYTNNKDQVKIIATSETEPTPGVMSLYAADGITFTPFLIKDAPVTRKVAYEHPLFIYTPKESSSNKYWLSDRTDDDAASWFNKAIHDPCPAGWRVPLGKEYKPLIGSTSSTDNVANRQHERDDGGALIYFDSEKTHSTYVRFNGYWRYNKELNYIGQIAMIWAGDNTKNKSGIDFSTGQDASYFRVDYIPNTSQLSIIENGHESAALSLRCIQEGK